jgi:outer membrane protein assembly factor BamB
MSTVLDTTTVPGTRLLYRLALLLAAVSGTLCIVFCTVIVIYYHGFLFPGSTINDTETNAPSYRQPAEDSFNRLPTDYHAVLALRQALAQDKQNEELQTQIRELDHTLRVDYFQRRFIVHQMAHFLILSSILFFVAIRTIGVLKRQIPSPNEMSRQSEKKSSWGFAVVTSWFMLVAGLYLGLLFAPPPQMEQMFLDKLTHLAAAPTHLAGTPAPVAASSRELATVSPITLTEELLLKNWISFRNFDGNGIGFSDNPPTQWDGKTGKNLVWQSEVPLPGNSSPIIWENKLFLTGADEETQKIFCYNIENGELLWTADITQAGAKVPEVFDDTGYAAPTPVVDGRHVYAMFANGELVTVDVNGNFVWRKSFGTPDNHYGFSSSPALHFDKLIVQFDNSDGEDGTSKIVALDLNNGNVLWETARDMPASWASPTIKKIGDAYQIIACADPYVIAYNPDDGKEIWRCKCLSGDVGPSAVSCGDIVLITNQSPRTTAIDATGSGDVTATHIRWNGVNALPDTPSPLATEEYFFTFDSYGILTGYDPKVINPNNKRAKYWELAVGDTSSFYSSPLRVGTYIYVFDKSVKGSKSFVIDLSKLAVAGDGTLTEESATAMILSENPMPEPCVTSPAVLNNRLYIRGAKTLYCIGEN